jgi:hypothetical protein
MLFIALSILAAISLYGLLGCKVLKQSSKLTKDSVHLKIKDSGAISKQTTTNENFTEWFKEISEIKDTHKITTIIREGGKERIYNNTTKYDSSWKQSYDSLKVALLNIKKSKEVKVLSWHQILMLSAGVSIVIVILSKLKIRFV